MSRVASQTLSLSSIALLTFRHKISYRARNTRILRYYKKEKPSVTASESDEAFSLRLEDNNLRHHRHHDSFYIDILSADCKSFKFPSRETIHIPA